MDAIEFDHTLFVDATAVLNQAGVDATIIHDAHNVVTLHDVQFVHLQPSDFHLP